MPLELGNVYKAKNGKEFHVFKKVRADIAANACDIFFAHEYVTLNGFNFEMYTEITYKFNEEGKFYGAFVKATNKGFCVRQPYKDWDLIHPPLWEDAVKAIERLDQ